MRWLDDAGVDGVTGAMALMGSETDAVWAGLVGQCLATVSAKQLEQAQGLALGFAAKCGGLGGLRFAQ